MQILRGGAHGVMRLAISADSRYVAALDKQSVSVWDLDGPNLTPVVTRGEWAWYPQFLGHRLLFRDGTHRWQSLDLATGQWSAFAPRGAVENVFAVSPSGEIVLAYDRSGGFSCWRLDDAGPRQVWSEPRNPLFPEETFFSEDSRKVFVRSVRSTLNEGHVALTVSEGATPVLFTPDGRTLLAMYHSRVYAYDAEVGGVGRLLIQHPQKRHFRALAVHPDGATLAAVTADDAVSFYDLASGELRRSYDWKLGKLKDVAFTPDGTRCVVTAARGKVLLFDVE